MAIVIVGALGELTVKVEVLVVTVPHPFVTIHLYWYVDIPNIIPLIIRDEVVANE